MIIFLEKKFSTVDYFPEILCFQGITKGGHMQTLGWRQCHSRATAGRTLGGRQPGTGSAPRHSRHHCTAATRSLGWGSWSWKRASRDQYYLTAAGRNAACLLPLNRIQRPWYSERKGSVAQACLTLQDRTDCRPPGSSVHAILQARTLEWVAMPSPGDLPDLGIELRSPALQTDSETLGKPPPSTAKRDLNQGYLTSSLVIIYHRKGS